MTRDATTTARAWVVAAAVLCVTGILVAVFAANAVARTGADRSRRQFESTAHDIAARLQLALEHEADLVATAKAYVSRNPDVTTTEFVQWANDEQALARYPELTGLGLVRLVPASGVPQFAAEVERDHFNTISPSGTFVPSPPGDRPYYCFVAAGAAERTVIPNNLDFCAGRGGVGILHARDSGRGSYEPVEVAGSTLLGVEEPVYAGGGVPATVSERRRALIGWVGMVIKPSQLLDAAASGFPVRMHYAQFGSDVAFSVGTVPTHGTVVRVDLRNGWTIETYRNAISASVVHDGGAVLLLVGGIVVSWLVGALILVLATGRARAQRIVRARTDELRHLAMHDPLTGLANRALLRDRCDRLVERSTLAGTTPAALYLDLDEFKGINDTLGHELGDQVLIAVAQRLSGAVREADTIARLGGDEFVVLLDETTVSITPAIVAERLRRVVSEPYELDGVEPLRVTVSIGVSAGPVRTPNELLRQADVALYRAKAAGRNAVVVFDPGIDEYERRLLVR